MTSKPDCYAYVRNYYQVPAYVGVRVRIGRREGVLVSKRTDLHYIHVRLDGQKFSVPAHPTDDVTYLVEAGPQAAAEGR